MTYLTAFPLFPTTGNDITGSHTHAFYMTALGIYMQFYNRGNRVDQNIGTDSKYIFFITEMKYNTENRYSMELILQLLID